jgi:protein-tyrosine-phosphatase
MKDNLTEKRGVTTARAVEIMRKNGIEIDEKKAVKVLELMYFFS